MMKVLTRYRRLLLVTGLLASFAGSGCQEAHKPTTQPAPEQEGRAIVAASIQHGMTLADLTGGDLGLGGGFLIAAAPQNVRDHRHVEALAAASSAEQLPAQLKQVHDSDTADLNHDGFITLDEVLAMSRAGLSDHEISDRLSKTGFIFHLTAEQERYLTDRGVSQNVVATLHTLSGASM